MAPLIVIILYTLIRKENPKVGSLDKRSWIGWQRQDRCFSKIMKILRRPYIYIHKYISLGLNLRIQLGSTYVIIEILYLETFWGGNKQKLAIKACRSNSTSNNWNTGQQLKHQTTRQNCASKIGYIWRRISQSRSEPCGKISSFQRCKEDILLRQVFHWACWRICSRYFCDGKRYQRNISRGNFQCQNHYKLIIIIILHIAPEIICRFVGEL